MDFQEIKTNFIKICHEAYEAENDFAYLNASAKAHGYLSALMDTIGIQLTEEVFQAAEKSFMGEVETGFGVPKNRRHKESALQPT